MPQKESVSALVWVGFVRAPRPPRPIIYTPTKLVPR